MTANRKEAMEILERIPEDRLPYIIQILHDDEKMQTDSEKGNLSLDQLVMEASKTIKMQII